MRLAAAAVSSVAGAALCAGGAVASLPPAADYSAAVNSASNVYAVVEHGNYPTRLYIADNAGKVTRASANAMEVPWYISVEYSLDGPDSTAEKVSGATGLVGIHIKVAPATDDARSTVPLVAFSIPASVATDINADDNVTIGSQGSSKIISALGHSGSGVEFYCYVNAKEFSMSNIALAVLPTAVSSSSDNDSKNDVTALNSTASTLVDSLTDVTSSDHQELIDSLKALRDNELKLAKSVIAEREKIHDEAFKSYMAAYVGSYTTHLSGSIGSSTQLTALIGTAKELSGDTPLAKAVLSLADAVNNVSAAHQHTGAADALDDIIRRIQQQGTTGLADELTAEAGEYSMKGSNQYKDGQSQLSAAMIPYSMKYTDVYTDNLSMLTGGTSSGASAYQQQAIDETNKSDELADSQTKVDAAMQTLAEASEFTGRATAMQQILLRFSDQFAQSTTDSSSDEGGLLSQNSLMDQAKAAEAKERLEERKEEAKKAQSENTSSDDGSIASLVNDRMEMASGDVMNYAGGMVSSLGASATVAGQDMVENNNVPEGPAGSQKTSDDSSDDSSTEKSSAQKPSAFGFVSSGSMVKTDMSTLIGETVDIADAAEIIGKAVTLYPDSQALGHTTDAVKYLIAIPAF